MDVANDSDDVGATKFHCVKCGRIWGDGIDIESTGICIQCFSEWAGNRKACFGIDILDNKQHCSLHKFCKEYYGIK